MELIRPFARIGKDDAGIAGGKGASLGEMTQAGIPVPPGFVVLASTFDAFVEATNLNVEIEAALAQVNHEEMNSVEQASERIQETIMHATMPEDIAADIKKNFAELGAEFVAVRSSATAEDSASAAWAGQLDTYLNTTEPELLTNVQRCWASLFTPRAIFYRFEKGLSGTHISVAVVVQKMVQSDASGIAFSVHPVTEDRNQLIIEASWGLGEAIVSGQVTPDSYVVTKTPREIIDKSIATKDRGMYRKEGGGNDWQNVPLEKRDIQTLSDEQILALSEAVVGIEVHYGFPCDIEWAMEAGKLYITQSRPITTLSSIRVFSFKGDKVSGITGTLYLSSPLVEVVKRCPEPIHFPFYALTWKDIAHGKADEWFDSPKTLEETKRIVDLIDRDGLEYFTAQRAAMIDRVSAFVEESRAGMSNVSALDDEELKAAYRSYMDSYTDVFGYGGSTFIYEANVSEELSQSLRKRYENTADVVTRALRSEYESFMVSSEKALGEIQAAHGKERTVLEDAYCRDFFMMTASFSDAPVISGEWIAHRIVGLEVPVPHKAEDETDVELTPHEKNLVGLLKESEVIRDVRKKANLAGCYVMMRFLDELIARTKIPKEIAGKMFWTEFEEVLNEPERMRQILQNRTEASAIFDGTSCHYIDYIAVTPTAAEGSQDTSAIQGVPAAKGKVTGPVRIVVGPEDFKKVMPGDVLVSEMTRPDYLPIMNIAAAFVTDEGGLTCHAAIVAREMKKPCIIGTKIATQVLSDGDMVEVDADNGIVRKI